MSLSFWYCNTCKQNILHGTYLYNCTVCEDYDQCEICYETVELRHSHVMVRELAFGEGKITGTRLNNMRSLILTASEMYADRHCFGVRDINTYSWITYEIIGNRIKNFAHGLRSLLAPRDHIGICAANRPEWLIADFACILHSMISVPMYCHFSDREFIYVINNIKISAIICDKLMLSTFLRLSTSCPTLRHLICIDSITNLIDILTTTISYDLTVHYMNDIEMRGSLKQYDYIPIEPNDCITIMHTSGTLGFPKGVMMSEQSFRQKFDECCSPHSSERIILCYRPLAWSSDRYAAYTVFLVGGRIGFSTGDLSQLMEEIALVRPTSFSSSPSLWNKIYSEFKSEVALAIDYKHINPKEAEEQLFERFSTLIPIRCKILVIGGAMVSSALLKFMKRCFHHCFVIESYGTTECGGISIDDSTYSGVKYRLESVPEMGYTIDDKPYSRGELLVKTKEIFSGYINNEEETKAALTDDGFYRTGDIVELRKEKYDTTKICVIDRKKNFFKLANGEFVSPEYLQGIYLSSPFIEQIYIHGNPMDNHISAVLVPNKDYAQAFISNNPEQTLLNGIIDDIHSIATKESLGQHEIPSKIIIDFEPFTTENGLLTPSLKLCRPKLAVHYADQLKNNKSLEKRIKDMFEMTIGRTIDTNKDVNLIDIGSHSLSAIRLSRMIQNELGVDIPLDVLFQPKMTIEELANLVQNPSRISVSSDTIFSKMIEDTQIDLEITEDKQIKLTDSPTAIFITGTTGYVGAFLLNELLIRYPSTCKLICLIRSSTTTTTNAFDRFYQNMFFLHLWKEDYRKRIILLEGDLSQENFGLNQETYEKLAKDIDIIFHCGAMVNSILPYNQLYASNVLGTREILRLANHTSVYIPIHYISTVSVLSTNMNEVKLPTELRNGYSQSKWVAEQLMIKAKQIGLPIVIYRLGRILADSQTGVCNRNDFYTLLIAAMIQVKSYSNEILVTNITGIPANLAVQNIIDISQKQIYSNQTIYNIGRDECIISIENLINCIHNLGIEMKCIPYDQWKQKILSEKRSHSLFKSIGEFLSENPSEIFYQSLQTSNVPSDYVIKWLTFIRNYILLDN